MSLVADVEIRGEELLLGSTVRANPEATLIAQYQATADTYTFLAREVDPASMEAALADDPTVSNPRCISVADGERTYRVDVEIDRQLVSEFSADFDIQVLGARSGTDGWIFDMRVPDRQVLAAFKTHCEEIGLSVRLHQLYSSVATGTPFDGESDLTPGQREALEVAHELGYFEQPRDASLESVAERLGVSSTAASDRLRRGIETLIDNHVVD